MDGHKQTQVYIEDGLWPMVGVLAKKLGLPIYKVINDALREKLHAHFTASELKALKALLVMPTKKKKGRIDVSGHKRKR